MYEQQQGRCAICDKSLEKDNHSERGKNNIDHDHKTESKRIIMCKM